MSHETVASIWSVLSKCPNLDFYIREAIGQYILKSSTDQDGSATSSTTILSYAVELTTVLDFIRTSNDAQSLYAHDGRSTNYQKCPRQALTYLIHNMLPALVSKENQKTEIYIQILTRAMLAAICALRSCHQAMRSTEDIALSKAARRLATHCSEIGGKLELLRLLCSCLSDPTGSNHWQDEDKRQSVNWTDICRADPETRLDMIENLIDAATKSDVNKSCRLQAIINLSQAYFESEATLIRNCVRYNDSQAPQTTTNAGHIEVGTAMTVRSLIQDNLINATLDNSTKLWAQLLSMNLLFTPGLYSPCALEICQCRFREPRRRKSRMLQTRLEQTYVLSVLHDCRVEDVVHALNSLNSRWEIRRIQPKQLDITVSRNSIMNNVPPHINSPSQGSISPKTIDQPPGQIVPESDRRWPTQPQISRFHSQKDRQLDRTKSYSTIDENSETMFDRTDARSTPALSDSGQLSPGQRSQAGTATTVTSSSQEEMRLAMCIPPARHNLPIALEENHKIVVDNPEPAIAALSLSPDRCLPEVVLGRTDSDGVSLFSHESVPTTIFSTQQTSRRGKWSNLLRGKKDASPKYSVPKSRFFASGKHILLWTQSGGVIIDPSQVNGYEFLPIRIPEILYAAGGTNKFVLITRLGERYQISVHHFHDRDRITKWELTKAPGAIDLSRNDRFLAVKYTRMLLLYDLQTANQPIQHRLPTCDGSRPGSGNHLVTFATDSQSFMAATRFQPEKVYLYWSQCEQSRTSVPIVTCCTAPSGDIADHGLTSLTVCSPTMWSCAGGFLTTFTEKGYPAILNMHPKEPSSRLLRECKEQIGTRIHGAAMSVDPETRKSNLVLVNQNNAVFWITDLLGNYAETAQVNTLKRSKSLKDEIQVAMSEPNEASIFWVDRTIQKGVLVKIGKGGGKANPVYFKLDIDPLCGV